MVEEELDETRYWLELIVESGLVNSNLVDELKKENDELFKIIVSTIISTKKKINSAKKNF